MEGIRTGFKLRFSLRRDRDLQIVAWMERLEEQGENISEAVKEAIYAHHIGEGRRRPTSQEETRAPVTADMCAMCGRFQVNPGGTICVVCNLKNGG